MDLTRYPNLLATARSPDASTLIETQREFVNHAAAAAALAQGAAAALLVEVVASPKAPQVPPQGELLSERKPRPERP